MPEESTNPSHTPDDRTRALRPPSGQSKAVPLGDRLRSQYRFVTLLMIVVLAILIFSIIMRRFVLVRSVDRATMSMVQMQAVEAGNAFRHKLFTYGVLLFFVSIAGAVVILFARWAAARRTARSLDWMCCPCCQFDLSSDPEIVSANGVSSVCPECGMGVSATGLYAHWERPAQDVLHGRPSPIAPRNPPPSPPRSP